MSSQEKKISVQRSDGEVEELTPEELERLNYDRKIRDQQNAGKRVTAKQINIAAVIICLIGLIYALPRILWQADEETSDYVPLSERDSLNTLEVLPPLPRDANAFLQGTPPIEPSIQNPEEVDLESIASTNIAAADITETSHQNQQVLAETVPDSKVEPSEEDLISELVKTIEQWADNWADQNVDAYLSHYSEMFMSERGQDLQAWRDYRSDRVRKPEWIEIQLYEITAELTAENAAQVTFEQIYSASNYADQSEKLLEMVLEDDNWKIRREITLQ